jgi:hypothetical protein
MSNDFWKSRVREGAVLSPIDRISEILFGLIMVLTFTGAISAASDSRNDVRELLWAALGCNVAWGLVDAVMYWMNVLLERGHGLKVVLGIQKAKDASDARETLKSEIQPLLASLMKDDELDRLGERIRQLPEPEKSNLLTLHDLKSGLTIFMLVFLCTLPVALPFAFIEELSTAMRVSNGVALLLLFVGGFRLARYAGFRPMLTALAYTLIGVLLVALTMALGG